MALVPGTRLGPYELSAQLGVGGMGEVYRATDTHLKRQVAIKVLPHALASDADRLARFQREAEVLASLNHPGIAQIHDLVESEGITALVMELVEGATLAESIARGTIELHEVLLIAKQITEALEAAHEQGIIHRDLKPANIILRTDGTVKVLDFGLAKLAEPVGPGQAVAVSMSPTITSPAMMTGVGVILGTAAYMSPEQARGKPVDKRADIWGFGCVLYEMLTGTRAFGGENVTDTLALVVTEEPEWRRLPPNTPSTIRLLLRRCLQKDRNHRLRDVGDVRLEIMDALTSPNAEPPVAGFGAFVSRGVTGRRGAMLVAGIAVAGSIVGGAVVWELRPVQQPATLPVNHVLVDVAPAERLRAFPGDDSDGHLSRTAIALSPDGRSLVFSAARGNEQQLYLRSLDRPDASPLPGTGGANSPFFSPDGQWVGFWAAGALKKMPLAGGPPVTITQSEPISGASWGTDDRIVFAHQSSGLWRVSAVGGTPEAVTTLDKKSNEQSHRLPQILPGGEAVLYTVIRRTFPKWDRTDAQVVVQSLRTGARTVLVDGGADGRYVPTGHLVYMRRGVMLAVRFDAARLQVAGGSRGVLADVMQSINMFSPSRESGAGQVTISESGTLAYLPGGPRPDLDHSLVWVDRAGHVAPLALPRRYLLSPRLSPDGKSVAFFTLGYDRAVWVHDLARGSLTKLAIMADAAWPTWTRDGTRLVFLIDGEKGGAVNLFSAAVDSTGAPEQLTRSDRDQWPVFFSPDGQTLAFVQTSVRGTDLDIRVLAMSGDRQPRAVLDSPAAELHPAFSPDGKWLAYTSNDSDRNEVYVQAYPVPSSRHPISIDGGEAPAWRADGRELFYYSTLPDGSGIRMMAVSIETQPAFTRGIPKVLFEGPYAVTGFGRGYDVTPDGQRFLMVQRDGRPPNKIRQIMVVQNWLEELKRLVPAN